MRALDEGTRSPVDQPLSSICRSHPFAGRQPRAFCASVASGSPFPLPQRMCCLVPHKPKSRLPVDRRGCSHFCRTVGNGLLHLRTALKGLPGDMRAYTSAADLFPSKLARTNSRGGTLLRCCYEHPKHVFVELIGKFLGLLHPCSA
jgi:hypothetical protein